MTVVLIIYATFMLAYMTIKALGITQPYRGLVKVTLSTTFLGVGAYYVAINGWKFTDILLGVALVFAWIGDFLLIYKHKSNMFHAGCTAFGVANAFLVAHSVLKYTWQWWSLILFAVFMATIIYCQYKNVFSFGRSKWYLNFYSVTVGYNGFLGLAVALTTKTIPALFFGLGSLLFLASDIVLGLFLFKIKKWQMDAFNTLLYFSGLMLIALSLA